MSSIANPRTDLQWVEHRFDRVAWSYPFFERLFLVPRRARDLAVERLQAGSGQCILSIGCGRGSMLPAISAQVGVHGEVHGLDLSLRMLQAAERTARQHDLKNIRLTRTDLLRYSPAEPYHSVLFGFSLSSFADPDIALQHAWSFLRPGGRLVVLDARIPPPMERITRPFLPAIRWFLEQTVLGDPDMRPLVALEQLGAPVALNTMRWGAYFVATVQKPE